MTHYLDIEIPLECKDELEESLKKKIGPMTMRLDPRTIAKSTTQFMNIVGFMRMQVSECREYLRMSADGSVEAIRNLCHMHDENAGDVQTSLAKIENEYRMSYTDVCVDALINTIFGDDSQSPLSLLDTNIREGRILVPKLKLAFNCTDADLVESNKEQEKFAITIKCEAALQQIGALFKRIPAITDITVLPKCQFLSIRDCRWQG